MLSKEPHLIILQGKNEIPGSTVPPSEVYVSCNNLKLRDVWKILRPCRYFERRCRKIPYIEEAFHDQKDTSCGLEDNDYADIGREKSITNPAKFLEHEMQYTVKHTVGESAYSPLVMAQFDIQVNW
jgi:hypothetical protein